MSRAISPSRKNLEISPETEGGLVLREASPAQRTASLLEMSLVWQGTPCSCDLADGLMRNAGALTGEESGETNLLVRCSRDHSLAALMHACGRVLVPKDDPDTKDVRASVEMHLYDMLLRMDGRTEKSQAAYAGKAFVPHRHRGKGYAKILAGRIAERFHWSGDDKADRFKQTKLIFGHAEAGREAVFSPRALWFVATEVQWLSQGSIAILPHDDLGGRSVRLIEEDELRSIIETDAKLIEEEFEAINDEGTTFCIVPSVPSHVMRVKGAKFIFSKVTRAAPNCWGAQIGDQSDPSTWAFALWMPSLADDNLKLVRVRAHTSAEFRALAASASEHAAWWGRKRVTARGVDEELVKGTDELHIRQGGDYKPGVAWVGPSFKPPLKWAYNQRYPSPTMDA